LKLLPPEEYYAVHMWCQKGMGAAAPCALGHASQLPQGKFWWWSTALWALPHAKVWLIKHCFCKTTQITVNFLHFEILENRQICSFYCMSKS